MQVVRGPRTLPLRVVIYGPEGVGKTTFASGAPAPVFLAAEDGCSELDVARFDPAPSSLKDIGEAIRALPADAGTLVIDSAGWVESIIHRTVAAAAKKPHIEDIPFGAGYKLALDHWRTILSACDAVRASGRHVVITAHSTIRPWRDPDGTAWDRWSISLHERSADLLRQWCDVLLFATWEQAAVQNNGRSYGVSTGARVAMTERTAAYDAKTRVPGLPAQVKLDWKELKR